MKKSEVLNQVILENSKIVEEIVYEIVSSYTSELDAIMKTCRTIFNSGQPMNDDELLDLLVQLPSNMYFTGEGQEMVGLREDVSKMAKMEKYNEARKKALGTIQDKNTEAEIESLSEALNQVIYQRAYKMIKNKIEMASELLNSLKRINDRRITEQKMTGGIR